jgi:hypothetical protein
LVGAATRYPWACEDEGDGDGDGEVDGDPDDDDAAGAEGWGVPGVAPWLVGASASTEGVGVPFAAAVR